MNKWTPVQARASVVGSTRQQSGSAFSTGSGLHLQYFLYALLPVHRWQNESVRYGLRWFCDSSAAKTNQIKEGGPVVLPWCTVGFKASTTTPPSTLLLDVNNERSWGDSAVVSGVCVFKLWVLLWNAVLFMQFIFFYLWLNTLTER